MVRYRVLVVTGSASPRLDVARFQPEPIVKAPRPATTIKTWLLDY
jgi:hypothetical protein